MTVEINSWEIRAIKEAVLKSAENLHLDPLPFAVQLIRAFEKIDGHYEAKRRGLYSDQITPGEFKFMGE